MNCFISTNGCDIADKQNKKCLIHHILKMPNFQVIIYLLLGFMQTFGACPVSCIPPARIAKNKEENYNCGNHPCSKLHAVLIACSFTVIDRMLIKNKPSS